MSRRKQRFRPNLNTPVPAPATNATGKGETMNGRRGIAIDLNKMAAYNGSQESMFTPGMPISPTIGIDPNGQPRTFQYPVGYNTNVAVRGLSDNPFEVLRNFAMLYDGITLCERVWLDVASKLKLKIKAKEGVLKDGQDEDIFQAEIDTYTNFFRMPDKSNRLSMKEFLAAAIIGQLRYDAVVVYLNRTKGGDLISLDLVDGATIKPLLGVRGEVVGYQQIVYNVPGDIFAPEDIWYLREKPQLDNPYGFSRIEAIMMTVNMALRKQTKDLAFWTHSNVPQAFMEIPEDVVSNPEELKFYEDMYNAAFAGNPQQQQRIKFGLPGWKFNLIDEPLPLSDFDIFLLKKTVAAYGLTMDEIGFTESSNRSVGDSQEAVVYRRTIEPVANMYAAIFTRAIEECFGDDRFEAVWTGYEEAEDFGQMATSHVALVTAGIESPSDAAKELGLPVHVDVGPMIMAKSGPMLLEDFADPQMRAAQKQAQMAGLQMAIANPGGQADDDKPEDGKDDGENLDEERKADLRRWRKRALDDIKLGRKPRGFTTTYIPMHIHERISDELIRCQTQDEVRAVFETRQGVAV